jgi:two-component system sensor histidine kinase RegB
MRPAAEASTTAINLRWLLRLRWGAALGQSAVIVLCDRLMDLSLPLPGLFAVIALEVASNTACALWARRAPRVPEAVLGALMALDVLLLTMLLRLSGGSFNPFNFLYLVHVTLAAVILSPRWAWGLTVLSLACFAALFIESPGSEHLDHAAAMHIHLRGMWVAFAVAAGFIVYFVHRIRRALADRDEALAVARARTARARRSRPSPSSPARSMPRSSGAIWRRSPPTAASSPARCSAAVRSWIRCRPTPAPARARRRSRCRSPSWWATRRGR